MPKAAVGPVAHFAVQAQAALAKEVLQKYSLKVDRIVIGGKERQDSVFNALEAMEKANIVLIHDGARPFVEQEVLERVKREMETSDACVVGMPVKDTIKIVNAQNYIKETPDRNFVWQIQTPQVFTCALIEEAYMKLMRTEQKGITDDAMVVEKMLNRPIKLVQGSYKNIKITTPEDLEIGNLFLK